MVEVEGAWLVVMEETLKPARRRHLEAAVSLFQSAK